MSTRTTHTLRTLHNTEETETQPIDEEAGDDSDETTQDFLNEASNELSKNLCENQIFPP